MSNFPVYQDKSRFNFTQKNCSDSGNLSIIQAVLTFVINITIIFMYQNQNIVKHLTFSDSAGNPES